MASFQSGSGLRLENFHGAALNELGHSPPKFG